MNSRQNFAGKASKECYSEYAGKAKQQQDQAFKWTWNMIVYFSHNSVLSKICCCKCLCECVGQQKYQKQNASSIESVLLHQAEHVPTAALSHQAYDCSWLLKMIQCHVVTQTSRWRMSKFRAEDYLFRWPEPSPLIFMWFPLPQTRFPLISPAPGLFCALKNVSHLRT